MSTLALRSMADILGAGGKTYARYPVWSNSAEKTVRFFPMTRKEAYAAYRKLREWNRNHQEGRYGGLIGAACLRVFESLVFDFMNYKTGRLDPSYEAIARKTGYSRATVAVALKRLKELRVISWVRRCYRSEDERGAFRLEQDTNAYGLTSPAHWRGYEEPPQPNLHPSEWGACPALPGVLEQALSDHCRDGMGSMLNTLRSDPADPLAAALARLGSSLTKPRTS